MTLVAYIGIRAAQRGCSNSDGKSPATTRQRLPQLRHLVAESRSARGEVHGRQMHVVPDEHRHSNCHLGTLKLPPERADTAEETHVCPTRISVCDSACIHGLLDAQHDVAGPRVLREWNFVGFRHVCHDERSASATSSIYTHNRRRARRRRRQCAALAAARTLRASRSHAANMPLPFESSVGETQVRF